MKINITLFVLSLLVTTTAITDAHARRMKDYSLSEKESLRLPSRNTNQSGNYDQFWNNNNTNNSDGINNGGGVNQQNNNRGFNFGTPPLNGTNYNTQLPSQASTQFMVGYCDDNFQPLLANSGRIAQLNACISEQKKQACNMFLGMPIDAQRAVDSVISCDYTRANEGQLDENGYVQQMPSAGDCTNGDSLRMNLLKQYWRDQNTAYAIVFLPDMVLNGAARCMGGQ